MKNAKLSVVVLSAVSIFGLASVANGAGAAAGGASGGGTASGGGAAHASSGGAGAPSGGASSNSGGTAEGHGGGATHVSPVNLTGGTTQTPANTSGSGTSGNHDGHDHHGNGAYPYGVAYPYSPFIGYGGGYGNNGVANTNNNQATIDNSPNNSVSPDQATASVPQVVTPADPNAAADSAKLKNAANHSPQVLALQAEVQRDQQEYDAARSRVLTQLHSQPEYQKAVKDRSSASAEVRSTKQAGPTNTNAVVSAAESKLEAGDAVTKMEQSAVDQDQTAATAKTKLTTAMTKLTAMRGTGGPQ